MSRSIPLLQKKLHELETLLVDAFRRDSTASDLDHDVEKRLLFLQNLLAAELASHPETSDQLREIEQKLATLKLAVRGWNKWRNSELICPEDSTSVCSDCTQALLFEDDDDDDVVDIVPIPKMENCCCEKYCSDCTPEEEEEEEEKECAEEKTEASRRSRGGIWKMCGAFGCGVIIGGICVLECLSASVQFIQYDPFILPPT